jgi:DNA-directed RNA polymerase specialized sigma24 family protein
MPSPTETLRTAHAARQRAACALTDAQSALRSAVQDAHTAGMSLEAIGRELGITRQAVHQLLRGKR